MFMWCWNDWKNDRLTPKAHMNVGKTKNLPTPHQWRITFCTLKVNLFVVNQNYRENRTITRNISSSFQVWRATLNSLTGHMWPPPGCSSPPAIKCHTAPCFQWCVSTIVCTLYTLNLRICPNLANY